MHYAADKVAGIGERRAVTASAATGTEAYIARDTICRK